MTRNQGVIVVLVVLAAMAACVRPTSETHLVGSGSGAFYNNGANSDWVEDFSALNKSTWTPEITTAGGGNFEFQFYNDSDANLFSKNGVLFIKPGLTRNYQLASGQAVLNRSEKGDNPPPIVSPFAQLSGAITTGSLSDSAVLGCGRSSMSSDAVTSCPGWGEKPFWWFDLGSQCTDNGKVYSLSYNACVAASGYFVSKQDTACADGSQPPCKAYWSIMNPVTSARVSTKNSQQFKYGRLEIKAKIPKGDWLWPAMWMMPANQTATISPDNPSGTGKYGVWPRSGEIDIVEARGNDRACSEAYMQSHPGTAFGGVQSFASTLHWGPNWDMNAFLRTHTEYSVASSSATLDNDFHIFGLRWNQDGLYTYIDNDANHVLEVSFKNQSFWDRATKDQFYQHCLSNTTSANGYDCTHQEKVDKANWTNPNPGWANNAAPFDQPFYLILNVAIGGTAGEGTTAYFPDEWCNKPWHNPDPADGTKKYYSVADFYAAESAWINSWGGSSISDNAALQVDEIRYWKEENAGTPSPLSPSAGQ